MNEIKPKFVEHVPDLKDMEEGIIYVSLPYQVAIHKCCCGCGNETVTPFGSPEQWQIKLEAGAISLHPSIGNFCFPCKSHYWIKNNKIEWA